MAAGIGTNTLIGEHVRGLSFVDIGGLWGTTNERVTVALAAGAKSATMLDYQAANTEWWIKFHERAAGLGFAGRYESVVGNLDDVDLVDKVGTFDFVHCSGIIYHVPSPFHTLLRLRALTKRYLIIGSMTVPAVVGKAPRQIDMSGGAAYFIPAIQGDKLSIFRDHFKALDVNVHKVVVDKQEPWMSGGRPNYSPWWWLWTPQTLASMAEVAGFRTLQIYEAWKGRAHGVFLEAI